MLAVRLERAYADMVRKLQQHHGIPQFTNYLRGLIYSDAVRNGLPVAGLDVPGWLTRSYPELFGLPAKSKGKARAQHGNLQKRKKK